jgi:hypothetical protein
MINNVHDNDDDFSIFHHLCGDFLLISFHFDILFPSLSFSSPVIISHLVAIRCHLVSPRHCSGLVICITRFWLLGAIWLLIG